MWLFSCVGAFVRFLLGTLRHQAMPEYDEYSKDFFGDKHFVMKGGSPFTDRQLTRLSLRNWFQAQYPYVWAKFRVCY